MKHFTKIALAAAVSTVALSPAAAQDFSLDPAYGTANLRTGYTPDPHRVSLRSGGSIDASRLGNGCRGYVANAPDYRVNYTSGRLPLYIFAESDADTTLVINGPDGRWYCDDDGGEGLNPLVSFSNPASGQYDVWVGTYGSARTESAMLLVSELDTTDAGRRPVPTSSPRPPVSSGRPDVSMNPIYGTANLRTGFTPDPYQVTLQSGGNYDASGLGNGCNGYVATAPDYRLNFDAGSSLPLVISVASRSDTTLVINGPDGRWYCDDDGGNNGLNPAYVFRNAQSGQYDIWVGTYGRASNEAATLTISELYSD